MKLVQLQNLALRGYQTFVEPANIIFPPSGVVLINGKNLDTKGGSGAGKTNLVGSIAYLFGYSSLPSTELKSWHSEEMSVTATIGWGDDTATIARGPGSLKVEFGTDTLKSIKAERKLQEILQLPQDFLEALTYRPQQKPGRPSGGFLGLGPTDKAKFLSQLLDLDKFEKAFDSATHTVSTLENYLITQHATLAKAQTEATTALVALNNTQTEDFGLDEVLTKINIQKDLLKEIDRRISDTARQRDLALAAEAREIRVIQKEFAQKEKEILSESLLDLSHKADRIEVCENQVQELEKKERSAYLDYKQAHDLAQQTLANINRRLAEIGDPAKALIETQTALEQVQNNVCNVCGKPWEGLEQVTEGVRLTQELKRLEGNLEAKREALLAQAHWQVVVEIIYTPDPLLKQYQNNLLLLKQAREVEVATHKADQEAALLRLRSEHYEKIQSMSSASQTQQGLLAKLTNIRHKTEMDLVRAEREYATVEGRVKGAQLLYQERQEQYKRTQDNVVGAVTAVVVAENQINEEKDFSALVGRAGYLGSIFEEVLQDISQRASSLMSILPNISQCSIKLSPIKTTKAGEKRAITPLIFLDGTERSLGSCSGGMTSSITLCVDLAVGQVIAERRGVRPGWLVLDECFDGMDAVTKEACLGLLRDIAEEQNLLILVIDHGVEFKEMFEKVVTVTFQNGKSSIATRYDEAQE